jgi:hypothetical protein
MLHLVVNDNVSYMADPEGLYPAVEKPASLLLTQNTKLCSLTKMISSRLYYRGYSVQAPSLVAGATIQGKQVRPVGRRLRLTLRLGTD